MDQSRSIAGYLAGLSLVACAGNASMPQPETSYAQLAAVLQADSVRAMLGSAVLVVDPVIRDASPRYQSSILQRLPALDTLDAARLHELVPSVVAVRSTQPTDTAFADTVLVTIAQVRSESGVDAPAEYIVQLRTGADWTAYELFSVEASSRTGQWVARTRWHAQP